MITVESRKDLKTQEGRYVLVRNEERVYVRVDNEYIPKQYFSVLEVASILGLQRHYIHRFCGELGIQAQANKNQKIRINFKQLRRMAEMK